MSEPTEPMAPTTAAAPSAAPGAPRPAGPIASRGVIHDIGYARYAGERRAPSTLWRVIMRHHLTYAWKTIWRFKPWLFSAVVLTLVVGVLMYVSQNTLFQDLRARGAPLSFLDGLLPFMYRFFVTPAFFLSMTVAAAVVARDRETGAFTFYFSRPVRPIDYVLGRLVGMTILTAIVIAAGPVLLAIFRIGLARSTSEAVDLIPWVGRALLVGFLAAVAYAALPLAFSAMAGKRTIALGIWAAWYVIGSTIVVGIGLLTWKPLAAIDLPMAVASLAVGLWDIELIGDASRVPVLAAVISLVGQSALAIFIFHRQIAKTAAGSVGGSS